MVDPRVPGTTSTVVHSLPATVVSYSDGEGRDAGVGISLYVPGHRPRAAFLKVPTAVRALWKMQRGRTAKKDIFEIEGIGPLAVMCQWPDLIRGRPWIHFIDHQGAQMVLIRGSGNSANGDVISGLTWRKVSKLEAWLWVERVASSSNPIDGVSRGNFEGPWACVEDAFLLRELIQELRKEAHREGLF